MEEREPVQAETQILGGMLRGTASGAVIKGWLCTLRAGTRAYSSASFRATPFLTQVLVLSAMYPAATQVLMTHGARCIGAQLQGGLGSTDLLHANIPQGNVLIADRKQLRSNHGGVMQMAADAEVDTGTPERPTAVPLRRVGSFRQSRRTPPPKKSL